NHLSPPSTSTLSLHDALPIFLRNQAYHINGNQQFGIYLDNVGSNAVVRDNLLFNNSDTGLLLTGASFESSGNVAFNNTRGFYYEDRKSTRLNSSHVAISYAVF